MLSDFVFSSFDYILNELCDGPPDGDGDGDETKVDNAAIFVAVAMLLRSTPHIYTARLPDVAGDQKLLVPLKIWILSQAPQDDLPACLFSWAHNLVPLLHTDPMARHLILCFVETILAKPDAPTILTDAPAWRGKRLIPPPSFEMLLRLTFPSARLEATARFEAIYPVLKKVTLARAPDFHIREIFTLCLRLAGEGISNESAKEATDIAISLLTDNADHDACWKHWDRLLGKMPKASAALVVNLVKKWDHLSPSSRKATEQSIQKLLICSLGSAGVAYSNPILAKEALWSLIEIVGCCKRCRLDHLYKIANLDPKFVDFFRANKWKKYFQKSSSYIREGTPESEELKQDTQQIFTASLKLAKQVKEAAKFALWPLLDNVDCWKLWDDLYTENLEASAAILKTLVDEWEFFSTQLSGDTRALSKTLKSFMLKNKKARGAYARLYRKADKSCQVIWRRLFPASSSSLNGSAITAVVLFAAVALVYSNLGATTWWTRCSCT
uniref:Uncharacterized protein n=1 Tax=Noccaea caerulescens TaxID=107243 RepID=A0A1J3E2Q0_NOCCA